MVTNATQLTKGGYSMWGASTKAPGASDRGAKSEGALLPSQGGLGRKAKRAASVMSQGGTSAKQAQVWCWSHSTQQCMFGTRCLHHLVVARAA